MTTIDRPAFHAYMIQCAQLEELATHSGMFIAGLEERFFKILTQTRAANALYWSVANWLDNPNQPTFQKEELLAYIEINHFETGDDIHYMQNPDQCIQRMETDYNYELQEVIGRGEAFRKILVTIDDFTPEPWEEHITPNTLNKFQIIGHQNDVLQAEKYLTHQIHQRNNTIIKNITNGMSIQEAAKCTGLTETNIKNITNQ